MLIPFDVIIYDDFLDQTYVDEVDINPAQIANVENYPQFPDNCIVTMSTGTELEIPMTKEAFSEIINKAELQILFKQ